MNGILPAKSTSSPEQNPRTLRSVRKRHIFRPPLPSFTQLREEPSAGQDVEVRVSKASTESSSPISVNVRPPTLSSEATTTMDKLEVSSPTDPVMARRAKRDRKRRRKAMLDMPLPPLPQGEEEPQAEAPQAEEPQALEVKEDESNSPVQYFPQKVPFPSKLAINVLLVNQPACAC
ncbi:hypothetical protein E1B28_011961 [Marasmius oreades]|uniref:Uncharacterized protein n=1 Tax=Marasmius oreades TaxID=181124 RepID=A0A9P7RQN1_9AGAR|nr:uncharacterized protein E1B28_011961 [Marasmius oreades]KAG7087912.1 hypothetical protein E1B28_011961 [Marasmius oreades]